MSEPLGCQSEAFGLPEDLHYLNCAYMGPLPSVTEEVGIRAIRRKRVPVDIHADDFFNTSDEVRRLFAALVGVADSRRIALIPGVSYGVAAAAKNLKVRRGQNVVLTHEQFPGNVHAWTRLAAESGAEARFATPPDGPGRGEAWNEALLASIDGGTAVVAVPHVHWTDGTRFDLVEVGRRCREVGAALVVDGTQSVGALPFDVRQVQPDALIVAGYKWLLGPYSVGMGYYGPRFDDGVPLEETWIGREKSEDFQNLVRYRDGYQPGALRYDVAERSNFALLPMSVASLELIHGWRPERIQAYCAALTARALEEAASLGFSVEDPKWRAAHLFGLRMPAGIDLAALKAALERRKVVASLRGSALRLSPNVYNDDGDMEALLQVLREAGD
ncbi:MAG TPA: aminotransferase class V-fold PLP-dependent enzyme [Longimicrobiales bacterium]|nr:aminotransferase class V-fold PLP-dependent enzyme [Longimicrobiales bacterium]